MSKPNVWLPHTLTEQNKEDRISAVTSLLSRKKNEPFLKNMITGYDEKWVLDDNVQRKRYWTEKNESPQSFPKLELQ